MPLRLPNCKVSHLPGRITSRSPNHLADRIALIFLKPHQRHRAECPVIAGKHLREQFRFRIEDITPRNRPFLGLRSSGGPHDCEHDDDEGHNQTTADMCEWHEHTLHDATGSGGPPKSATQSPCFSRRRALKRSSRCTRSNSSSHSCIVAFSSSCGTGAPGSGQCAPSCLAATVRYRVSVRSPNTETGS